MKVTSLPAILAIAAVSCCIPAFAKTAAPKDQASTAHQDTEFLKKANQGSVNEIDLAQVALKKTTNPEVKELAEKIVKDHTMLLENMKPFDMEAGITPPEHADLATDALKLKFEVLSGETFDKSYIKAMVEDHHKDLTEFLAEEKSTGYPEFKSAVSKGADVVKEHLVMVNKLAVKNGLTPAPVPTAGK